MSPLFAFLNIGPMEWIIIGVIAILLFGKNLPNVARSLGKSMVEFKKGVKGLEDDLEGSMTRHDAPAALEPPRPPQRVTTNVPKFEDNAGAIQTPPKMS